MYLRFNYLQKLIYLGLLWCNRLLKKPVCFVLNLTLVYLLSEVLCKTKRFIMAMVTNAQINQKEKREMLLMSAYHFRDVGLLTML